jgi:hypothetical protein
MSSEKYIGLDVHQATISVAVVDSQGTLIMESILETKGLTLLEFFAGARQPVREPSKKAPGPPGSTIYSSRM